MAAMGCVHGASYSVVSAPLESEPTAEFHAAVRAWIMRKAERSGITYVETANLEALNRRVRHCRDARGTRGCRNLGHRRAVIIDEIVFTRADNATARLRYFENEPGTAGLQMTTIEVQGVRSSAGSWGITLGETVDVRSIP
jgi:hypothetical protein